MKTKGIKILYHDENECLIQWHVTFWRLYKHGEQVENESLSYMAEMIHDYPTN